MKLGLIQQKNERQLLIFNVLGTWFSVSPWDQSEYPSVAVLVNWTNKQVCECHVCSNLLQCTITLNSSSTPTSHFLILKMDKPDAETENNTLTCTKACIGDCVIISTREFAFPYSSTVPFWRDQIQGCQIKRSADMCWLHRVMSRPRGYLQGHTKELVWSGKENRAYSRKPSN